MQQSIKTQTILLSGLRSDSHTWGLAYLNLRLEEQGFLVRNLGSCVPPGDLAEACRKEHPTLVVLTSVNGHGAVEAMEIMLALHLVGCVPGTPVVIGGKLTTSVDSEMAAKQRLLDAGFSGVFMGRSSLAEFDSFLVANGLVSQAAQTLETAAA